MTPLEQLQATTAERQAKRRRPAKPVKPPESAERYYRAQLRSLVQAMAESIERHVAPTLKRIKPEYTADSWSDDIEGSLEAAWAPFAGAAMEAAYQRLAREFVSRVTQETTERLVRSVNQAAGVNLGPIFEADGMRDFMRVSIEQNTSLISSVPEQYFKRVRTVVYEGVAGKVAPTTIASRIQEATGVTYRQARVIARDQNAKITSQVNERRQNQAGIKYYRAVDAGDERVTGRPGGKYPNARISCWGIARKDIGYGKGVYTWKDGASWGGETGLHPGRHHPLCRCTASPVFESEIKKKRS